MDKGLEKLNQSKPAQCDDCGGKMVYKGIGESKATAHYFIFCVIIDIVLKHEKNKNYFKMLGWEL